MRIGFNRPTALIASAAIAAAFSLAAIRMTGQAARTSQATPPVQAARAARTPDGHPNLNGIWQATTTANWDLLAHTMRPAVAQPGVYPDVPVLAAPVLALGADGGVPPGPGVVEGNEIPYKPEAAAKKKDNAEHWLDRDPEVRCYTPGIPRAMYMPYPFRITQGTSKIEMSFEFAGASRTIHLDPVDPPPADTWMGHSAGHWEGNTLVVDVSHFNDRTWFSRSGDFHSDALHVVERFTPITPRRTALRGHDRRSERLYPSVENEHGPLSSARGQRAIDGIQVRRAGGGNLPRSSAQEATREALGGRHHRDRRHPQNPAGRQTLRTLITLRNTSLCTRWSLCRFWS